MFITIRFLASVRVVCPFLLQNPVRGVFTYRLQKNPVRGFFTLMPCYGSSPVVRPTTRSATVFIEQFWENRVFECDCRDCRVTAV